MQSPPERTSHLEVALASAHFVLYFLWITHELGYQPTTNLPEKEESDNSKVSSTFTRRLLQLTAFEDFTEDLCFLQLVFSSTVVCTLESTIPSSLWHLALMLASLSVSLLGLVSPMLHLSWHILSIPFVVV